MNRTFFRNVSPRLIACLVAMIGLATLATSPAAHAAIYTPPPPTLPTITYTITGSGKTGKYTYQDITFTIAGYSNVDPSILSKNPEAYDVYAFSNGSFEDAGGIVAPASLPPNWVFSDDTDFTTSTTVTKGIFATDPLNFSFVVLTPKNVPNLYTQVFTLTTTNANGTPGNTLQLTPTPAAAPEASSMSTMGIFSGLIALGLLLKNKRSRLAVDRTR